MKNKSTFKKGDFVQFIGGSRIVSDDSFTVGKVYRLRANSFFELNKERIRVYKDNRGRRNGWLAEYFVKFEGNEEVANLLYTQGDDNEKRQTGRICLRKKRSYKKG